MTGAGQFGTPEQGIFAFWVNAHLRRRPLQYIGFDGMGKQVRDALHPGDLAALLREQMSAGKRGGNRVYTAGGGPQNAMSLAQLTSWCNDRFGTHVPTADCRPRPYDIPWIVMDNSSANDDFGWWPERRLTAVLEEIAGHAERHPEWLELSNRDGYVAEFPRAAAVALGSDTRLQ